MTKTMEDLNRRNTETVKLTLKDMLERLYAQQARIDGLNATITTSNSRIDELQQSVNMLRAIIMGRGPTSK